MLYDASTYLINVKDKGKINKFTSASQICPGCISWIMKMTLENIINPPKKAFHYTSSVTYTYL